MSTSLNSLALQCRALAKSFGTEEHRVHALRGVDLDVFYGELMMLVGPSGCGKTTLISLLAGILDPTSGTCQALGRDLFALSPSERTDWRREHVGFVFQAFNLIPTLTAQENVSVPLLINGMPQAEALKRSGIMLERVGLSKRADHYPAALSGGQQQRVAIARSLIHRPRLLVCDEPTSALDHDTGQQIMRLLKSMASEEDRALIVVTHDTRIFPYADRIARMDDGDIVEIHAATKPTPEHGAPLTDESQDHVISS
ncbi:MAG: ABC transporter ATP-binding protein [Gammaproteobacteria bacterium]|nr:ABC transporter ATP-binding protein [Gammaproteobacteria bacterium]